MVTEIKTPLEYLIIDQNQMKGQLVAQKIATRKIHKLQQREKSLRNTETESKIIGTVWKDSIMFNCILKGMQRISKKQCFKR